jgi:hypothetical protein
MATIDRLQALLLRRIRQATDAYLEGGGDVATWQAAMERALTTGHTAAAIAGIARRTGHPVTEARMLPADRERLGARLSDQLDYLAGFATALRAGQLTPGQIHARADLYSGAIRATETEAQYGDWVLPFVPCDGSSQCLGNCRCSTRIVEEKDGTGWYYWDLGPTEEHCTDCPERADGSPYRVERRKVVTR